MLNDSCKGEFVIASYAFISNSYLNLNDYKNTINYATKSYDIVHVTRGGTVYERKVLNTLYKA